jgi:hypothetical protein
VTNRAGVLIPRNSASAERNRPGIWSGDVTDNEVLEPPQPEPDPGQILIKTIAVFIDPADLSTRSDAADARALSY